MNSVSCHLLGTELCSPSVGRFCMSGWHKVIFHLLEQEDIVQNIVVQAYRNGMGSPCSSRTVGQVCHPWSKLGKRLKSFFPLPCPCHCLWKRTGYFKQEKAMFKKNTTQGQDTLLSVQHRTEVLWHDNHRTGFNAHGGKAGRQSTKLFGGSGKNRHLPLRVRHGTVITEPVLCLICDLRAVWFANCRLSP